MPVISDLMKKKAFVATLISIASALLIFLLSAYGFFEPIELKTYDYRCRWLSSPSDADSNIVIVAIDEKSLQEFKRRQGIVWKWPRDIYGELVEYLYRGGAKIIIFDIIFAEPDFDRANSDAEETDGAFANAMSRAGNVVLASAVINDTNLVSDENTVSKSFFTIQVDSLLKNSIPSYSGIVLPISKFQSAALSIGTTNFYVDPEDGVCRRVELITQSKFPNVLLPHISVSAYCNLKGSSIIKYSSPTNILLDSLNIKTENDGKYLIWWYGKGGPDECFKYYSYASLIVSSLQERMNQPPIVSSSQFKDKIVIVGANAIALADLQNTPVATPDVPYPGMEIYASIISNFTQKDFISRNHQFIPILFTFIFAVIVTFSFIYGMRVSFVGGFSIVLILLWLLLAGILFKMDKLWLDVTIPVTSIIFSFALAAAISYQTEGKARKRLKNTFSRYLSPIVISELIEKSEDVGLGGKEINGTVYFSDIKDFTTVSESLSPSELVSLLNDYFGIVSEEILHRGGLLDKYIGDAVMAVFGAPLTHHDHAIQACSAALGVQRLLAEQWIKVGRGRPPLETRIGINTGPMVVGNIGSPRRLDYTAIGDTVNLASRLEGANKVYKTNIIVSASTLQFTRDLFVVRELDLIRAKGKKKPTSIYEVIGVHNEVPEQVLKRNRIYHEGIELFREKQFAKSKKAFERVLAEFQNDGPSSVYIQRCEYFITHPPTMDWDGVFTMESK